MKKLLVTGASGFLGSHVCDAMSKAGWEIAALVRPQSNQWRLKWLGIDSQIGKFPCDPVGIREAMLTFAPDATLHCATDYGRKNKPLHEIVQANIVLPLLLLEHMPESCVFLNTDTILDKRINNYSLSKTQFRQWMTTLAGKRKLVNIALEHFFGAGDDNSKFTAFLFSSLCSNVASIPLTLGEQKRSFVHISDVASAFRFITEAMIKEPPGSIQEFQIGSAKPMRLRTFCELSKSISGASTRLDFGAIPYRSCEAMNVTVNLKALTQLGWRPLQTTEQTIIETFAEQRALNHAMPWLP